MFMVEVEHTDTRCNWEDFSICDSRSILIEQHSYEDDSSSDEERYTNSGNDLNYVLSLQFSFHVHDFSSGRTIRMGPLLSTLHSTEEGSLDISSPLSTPLKTGRLGYILLPILHSTEDRQPGPLRSGEDMQPGPLHSGEDRQTGPLLPTLHSAEDR